MKTNQLSNNNWKTFGKFFLSIVIAFMFGSLSYIVIMGAFPNFSLRYSGEENWNLLEGYASVISLALLLGGLAFAFVEYTEKENAKQHEKLVEEREKVKLSYDIYKAIFEKLTAPEQEAARRWILSNISIKKDGEELAAWYEQTHARILLSENGVEGGIPEGQRSVKLTLNCFDYIGFIANHYWDVEEDSLDWISPPIAKVWRRIGPYIKHVRTLRGSKDYYVSAEYIGNLCIKWRQDKGLPDEEYVEKTP